MIQTQSVWKQNGIIVSKTNLGAETKRCNLLKKMEHPAQLHFARK
jgi:hypothetical protein